MTFILQYFSIKTVNLKSFKIYIAVSHFGRPTSQNERYQRLSGFWVILKLLAVKSVSKNTKFKKKLIYKYQIIKILTKRKITKLIQTKY